MKFSDIEAERWEELKPYLDTCLLPVTGLDGTETPYEATSALENLRDVMALVEVPFKGRLVTYPAYHFYDPSDHLRLDELCRRLRMTGFRYIIVATAKPMLGLAGVSADLFIAPAADGAYPQASEVQQAVAAMWQRQQQKNETEAVATE